MLRRTAGHVKHNVVAYLALFVSLGGSSAYAANTVFSSDIVDGEVGSADVKDNSINTFDVHSFLGVDIVDGTVAAEDLASNSVGSTEILTDAVRGSDIADNTIDTGEIINNSLTTADIAGADVNPGLISFSAGSVANGRCEDFATAAGGAVAGQAVVISLQGSLPQGILIYGTRVPSNGTVTMKLCNLSGGAMAAINDLPIRVITFG
jgi:hypothetical protein